MAAIVALALMVVVAEAIAMVVAAVVAMAAAAVAVAAAAVVAVEAVLTNYELPCISVTVKRRWIAIKITLY